MKLDGVGRLHQQVYRALLGEILGGRLASGERVPSTRHVASLLKVSRNTALQAYEQLLAEGFIVPRSGAAGTVVASVLPPDGHVARPPRRPGLPAVASAKAGATPSGRLGAAPTLAAVGERYVKSARACADVLGLASLSWELSPPTIRFDFRPGRASFGDLPYALWRRLLNARARDARVTDLEYGPPAGRRELREAIATRLRRLRGLDANPDNIVIVNGTQQALDLICRVLVNPGDRVLMENPHYTGARCAFMAAGAEMVFSPVDDDGMRVPPFDFAQGKPFDFAQGRPGAGGRRRFRLAYVTPSHQFPTGAVMSMERRLQLIAWAAREGAFIVEDDYDGEYRYDGPPLQALTGMDPAGCTIYVGTFSKILFPAMRLGYLVLPPTLVEPIVATKAIADTGTPALVQLALADFIAEGHFDRHLRRTTVSNAARRHALTTAIETLFGDRATVSGASAGLHLLVWLRGRNGGVLRDVHATAERVGVGLYTVDPFYAAPPKRTGILLGFAPLMPADIREGIRRLAGALR